MAAAPEAWEAMVAIHRHPNAALTEPPGKTIVVEQTDLLIIPKDHSPVFIHHQECTEWDKLLEDTGDWVLCNSTAWTFNSSNSNDRTLTWKDGKQLSQLPIPKAQVLKALMDLERHLLVERDNNPDPTTQCTVGLVACTGATVVVMAAAPVAWAAMAVIHQHHKIALTEPPGKTIVAEQTDLLIILQDNQCTVAAVA